MSEVTELEVHGDGSFEMLDDSFDVQTPILENMVVGVPPVFEGLTKQLEDSRAATARTEDKVPRRYDVRCRSEMRNGC